MGGEALAVLAVCEGGSELLSGLFVLGAAIVYGLAVAVVFRGASDEDDTTKLSALMVGSVLLGGVLFAGLAFWYSDDGTAGVLVVLAAVLGNVVAVARWHGASLARAIVLDLLGVVLIPGAIVLLFFASFAIGSGCLE